MREIKNNSTIIIGLGVFGLSVLRQAEIDRPITVIACHHAGAPSDDILKIIRADYPNVDRSREADQALQQWKADPSLKPHFRPRGRVVAYEREHQQTLDDINNVRKELQKPERQDKGQSIMAANFGAGSLIDEVTFVFNDDDGLVNWDECLAEQRDIALKRLPVFRESVDRLICARGSITSIILESEKQVDSTNATVILAAGPWILEILERSGISLPPQPRQPVATGVFSFLIALSEEQREFFENKPSFSHYGRAEFLPPVTEDGMGKITYISPFTNLENEISRPKDLSNSAFAAEVLLKAVEWAQTYIPKLQGAEVVKIRTCWDGVTSNQTCLIARHPQIPNLIVAGGGSFHHGKGLPINGNIIWNVADDVSIDPIYGWNPTAEGIRKDQPLLMAKGDFRDLDRAARNNPRAMKMLQTINEAKGSGARCLIKI